MNSREKIVQHLTQQKAQSKVPGGDYCAYRGVGGLMCAVGCLIPDELYIIGIENLPVVSLDEFRLPKDISTDELTWWQAYHDREIIFGDLLAYHLWIEGDESQSPTVMAKRMEKQYGKLLA